MLDIIGPALFSLIVWSPAILGASLIWNMEN